MKKRQEKTNTNISKTENVLFLLDKTDNITEVLGKKHVWILPPLSLLQTFLEGPQRLKGPDEVEGPIVENKRATPSWLYLADILGPLGTARFAVRYSKVAHCVVKHKERERERESERERERESVYTLSNEILIVVLFSNKAGLC